MSQPDIALAGELDDLRGAVGIYGVVHHEDGELRGASGGEVEKIFAGNHEDGVATGNFAVGVGDEFLEIGEPVAAHGKAAQSGQVGVFEGIAGEIGVVEALVAEGVVAAGDEQYEGDDDSEGGRVAESRRWRVLSLGKGDEDGCDQDDEQGPEGISGAPELLREKGSVDGSEEDERERVVRWLRRGGSSTRRRRAMRAAVRARDAGELRRGRRHLAGRIVRQRPRGMAGRAETAAIQRAAG